MDEATEDDNQSICLIDKLLTEAHGSDHIMVQPSSLTLPTANVTPNQSTNSKKKNIKRRAKDRVKTEPANQWLQFLSEKRKLNTASDPALKLDLKDVRSKWWGLKEGDKKVYKEKAVNEKVELGDNFRNKSLNEERVVHQNTPPRRKKKCTKKKAITKEAPSIENHESLTTLMTKFKDLEKNIEELEADFEGLKNEKVVKLIEVATKKANLKHKSDSISVLKDKIANMKKIHIKCKDSM